MIDRNLNWFHFKSLMIYSFEKGKSGASQI